jgi:hypothetical protein
MQKFFTSGYTCIKAIAGMLLYARIFCNTTVTHQKWVNLFDEEPYMLKIETAHYIKGMHNLMGSHFDLGNHKKLIETLAIFEQFCQSRACSKQCK